MRGRDISIVKEEMNRTQDMSIKLDSAAEEAFGLRSVCELFEEQVARVPDQVALIYGDRSLTYRELDNCANQLAHYLVAEYDLAPESLVGLLLTRSERMLISIFAVLKAGAAYVPISPEYPPARISYILDEVSPALLLTEPRCESLVAETSCKRLLWDSEKVPWNNESTDCLVVKPNANQLAYVMFTSGSTGWPKGVMVEHENLSNFIEWCVHEYSGSVFDIVYASTPYFFDLSNIEIFYPLAIGSKIRLLPSSEMIGLYLRRDHNVLLNTVPSLVQNILKTSGLLEKISVLNLGGEPITQSLDRALRSYTHVELRNMYGPTETTSTAINYRFDQKNSEVLIGKPIANTIAYIVDEHGNEVVPGEVGEIWIAGRGVTRGYLNKPGLTAERFISDPFQISGRLYRTGDIGAYTADGNIRYLGRNDNQVKIRGHRIELDEISRHLENHPEVIAAVAGLKKSDAGGHLTAFIQARSNQLNDVTLKDFASKTLPPYMVPDEYVFAEALPLTLTGKIDRITLFDA